MNVDFSKLNKIEDILKIVIKLSNKTDIEKKWLSVKELSIYLDYSQDRIHKLKNIEFFENIHYYKRSGKLLFDKNQIDKWVMGIGANAVNNIDITSTVNNIISDITA
jgi:hypothetical protein